MTYLKRIAVYVLILTAMLCMITGLTGHIQRIAKIASLLGEEETKEILRRQEVLPEWFEASEKYEEKSAFTRYDYLAAHMLANTDKKEELDSYLELLYKYHSQKIREVTKIEEAVWKDLTYFPIPLSQADSKLVTSYENSWMFDRDFGGKRGHEGTDVMASLNERGRYPVVSMTDGVVEKIGWLNLGGYRIGIRAPNGAYFYYAHLYDYAREFQEGDQVNAGELLGFMGDSGYGEEGTTGKFAVHLHVGIYVNDEYGQEISLNPYWVLRRLESLRLSYQY